MLPETPELFLTLLKFVLYATGVFAAGGEVFLLFFRNDIWESLPAIKRHLRQLAVAGLVLVPVNIAAFVVWLSGGDFAALRDWQMIELVVFSAMGLPLALQAFGFAVIALSLRHPWIGLFGALCILAAYVSTGHTSTFEPAWLLKPLLALHLAILSFWLGSLWPLLHLTRRHGVGVAHILERFGEIAALAVPVLLLTGAIMAWFLAGGAHGLFQTGYGWLLLSKVAVVTLLLGFAAVNKLWLVPALARNEAGVDDRLTRSIRMELFLVLLILACTAVLTTVIAPSGL